MVYPQNPIKIKTLNTAPMNLRAEPTSKSASIAKVPAGYVWDSRRLATGELVKQNGRTSALWYGVTVDETKVGFVSAVWADEVKPEPNAELIKENQKLKDTIAQANRMAQDIVKITNGTN